MHAVGDISKNCFSVASFAAFNYRLGISYTIVETHNMVAHNSWVN